MNVNEIVQNLEEEIKSDNHKELINEFKSLLFENVEELSKNENFFNLPLNNIFSVISKVDFNEIEENDKIIEIIQNFIKNIINKHFEEKETILILQNLNFTKTNSFSSYEEIFSLLELITNCPILVNFCKLYKEHEQLPDKDYKYEIRQKEEEIEKLKQEIYEPDIFKACKEGKLTNVQWLLEKEDKNKTDHQDDTTITLKPFESSGGALIIPSSYYNDSAFSEYLILEYKTPTGLNKLDATEKYRNAYPLAFSNGLAIYHVDARLIEHQIQDGYYTCGDYLSENESSVPEVEVRDSREYVYLVGNSNTPSYNGISDDYARVRLISKERTLYSENPKTSRVGSTRRDLYQAGDSFGTDQIDMFFSHNTFNNGTPINNISIEVTAMNEEGITLHISR